MANFNLDNIIGKCVHRPIASNDPDKYPLYKRNDGAFDELGGKQTSRSDAWKAAVEKHYSSPNNIRRIFITREGVYVHFFRPFSGAKDSTTREAFYKYSSVNDKFNPIELYKAGDNRSAYKFGLGCLRDKWVCSNIEEIYFDWTLLLSRDLISLGLGNLIADWTKGGNGKILPGDVLWAIFSRSCLKNGENISRIFPRLKVICYVNELNILYNAVKRKPGEESAQDLCTPWYKNAQFKAAIADRRFCVSLYKVPNVSAINKKYSTRSYYCFDTEKLEPYFASVVEKLGTLEKKDEEDNSFLVRIDNSYKQFPCVHRDLDKILENMHKISVYTHDFTVDKMMDLLSTLLVGNYKPVVTKLAYIVDDNFLKVMNGASNKYTGYNFEPYGEFAKVAEVIKDTKLLPELHYTEYNNETARKSIKSMCEIGFEIEQIVKSYIASNSRLSRQYVLEHIKEINDAYLFTSTYLDGSGKEAKFILECIKNNYDPETGKYGLKLRDYLHSIMSVTIGKWVNEACCGQRFSDSHIEMYKSIFKKVADILDNNLICNDKFVASPEKLDEAYKNIAKECQRILECYEKTNGSTKSELSSLLHSVENESGLEAAQQTLSMLIGLKSSNEKELLEQLSPSDIERYKR